MFQQDYQISTCLHSLLTSVTMVASYRVLLYTHPLLQPVVSLSPYSLMSPMSQSTGTNIRHLLKVPSSSRGRVRFSCPSVVRLGSALRIQSVLQCRSGSDSINRRLARKKDWKQFGKQSAIRRSFWNNPNSPMLVRISPKSAIPALVLPLCVVGKKYVPHLNYIH